MDLLQDLSNVKNAPPDSYLIYNMKGGIHYLERKHYDLFCKHYILSDKTNGKHLTMDLAFAKIHSLVLDIDLRGTLNTQILSAYISLYLKPTLKSIFDNMSCFTYICALRPNGGLHVYIPEFIITNDDYIHFCTQLQTQLSIQSADYQIILDIPKNFNLATSCKPNQEHHVPFSITFIENNSEICLPLHSRQSYVGEYKKLKFKNKKTNSNSVFRKLIYREYDQLLPEIYACMMPYAICTGIQFQQICYQTIVSPEQIPDYKPICSLKYDTGTMYINKSNNLNFKSISWMSVYNKLHSQFMRIQSIESENHAIKQWYKYFKSSTSTVEDIFCDVNKIIKEDNCYWRTESHPLRNIIEYADGYYFLPVFYALCQHMNLETSKHRPISPKSILDALSGWGLDNVINDLKRINERIFDFISAAFSIDTILYCASHVVIHKTKQIRHLGFTNMLDIINEQKKDSFMQCTSILDYEKLLYAIVGRYTNIKVGVYKDSCKKPTKQIWNLCHEYWQTFINEDCTFHVQVVCKRLQIFCTTNDLDKSFNKIQIVEVSRYLLGEANMERIVFDMDKHKFHMRTNRGILDILSGHIGSTVPEFFLSDKCINIKMSKERLMCRDAEFDRVYEVLISKRFFRKFLKYVLTDQSDDYHDVCKIVATEFGIYKREYDSILNFYCNICKYMSFEYTMVSYMLYIISSMFIGTNYYRKFFIFQGRTKNGKSKFFEMFSHVFGNYSHSIRNLNLTNYKGGPQAELATTLHCCRIITVEELCGRINENFIKELTGNSKVSCRTMYETESGGIPMAKVFASTNDPIECTATAAFRDRVLTVPFQAYFTEKPPRTLSEQVLTNTYQMDESDAVVYSSCDGMRELSLYHMRKQISTETGLLDIPDTPEVMVEFKEEYLKMTDIYAQFKQYVDLQIIQNSILLHSSVVSTIRNFITREKKSLNSESDILTHFEEEFAEYRMEDESGEGLMCLPALNNNDDDEDGEGDDDDEEEAYDTVQKKRKIMVIYYQNVCIKNIKK